MNPDKAKYKNIKNMNIPKFFPEILLYITLSVLNGLSTTKPILKSYMVQQNYIPLNIYQLNLIYIKKTFLIILVQLIK